MGRFRQNVKAQIHSFQQPVMYKVSVMDIQTGLSECKREATEEEAERVALRNLLLRLVNEELVRQILALGLDGVDKNGARRSCVATGNSSLDAAVDWACEHMADETFNLDFP